LPLRATDLVAAPPFVEHDEALTRDLHANLADYSEPEIAKALALEMKIAVIIAQKKK